MQAASNPFSRHEADGLAFRWSSAEDAGRIAALHSLVHRENAQAAPNAHYMRIVYALMSGAYPFMGPCDFALIEDTTREGRPVVASTCLWRHTWTYEGIPFSVGRPEMVATDPAYRHRGLIRRLFEQVHARSEAEGDLAQAITGIAYFYRQFGYEYALELEDRRATPLALIPPAPEGQAEGFTLRQATPLDIPHIMELYQRRCASGIVAASFTHADWLYEIETWKKHPALGHDFDFQMILDAAGQTVGFVACDARRRGQALGVWLLEFVEGINMQAALPPVLRALRAHGLSLPAVQPTLPALRELSLSLGTTHPVHELLGEELDAPREPPYAWYIRVKDLPAFLLRIAPALEKRVADSPVAGYSGEIKLDFYRDGLRLVFERGRLVSAEPWRAPLYDSSASGQFPPLTFLQVLFGHRSPAALRQFLPDVAVSHEARPILKALFPTRPSFVFGWN
ncbi:MAG TPA: GNAT family N-acetyltransferase [Ktedonobacteraceae bacterium]|nr:GNAT family N-acetyltransferase [Ktedonobacteraceae bacterium]